MQLQLVCHYPLSSSWLHYSGISQAISACSWSVLCSMGNKLQGTNLCVTTTVHPLEGKAISASVHINSVFACSNHMWLKPVLITCKKHRRAASYVTYYGSFLSLYHIMYRHLLAFIQWTSALDSASTWVIKLINLPSLPCFHVS